MTVGAIVVIDLLPQPYDGTGMLHSPLGGTQSAVMDTCIRLADAADTVLYNGVPSPRTFGRLHIRPNSQITLAELAGARWIVFVSWVTEKGLAQLPWRKGGPKVALWAHHDVDQRAVEFLAQPMSRRAIARYLFVSRWQRDRYVQRFGLDPDAATVIGNPYCDRALAAVGPGAKSFERPRLIYASTPFRGLNLLADAFPLFRRRWPDAELTVLSGMELYGMQDDATFAGLFARLAATPGVALFRPSGKLDLYRRLCTANLFAFPSTFPETFCIAALEARVLGNPLLLTRLGALPEIFEGARFFDAGAAPSPEAWAQFMAEGWSAMQSPRSRQDLLARQQESRERYAPAAVAGRLLRGLGAEGATAGRTAPAQPEGAPAALAGGGNRGPDYSICVVTIPGYPHSRVFAETALGLQEGFAELGVAAPIVDRPEAIVGRGIVLGANLLHMAPDIRLPDDAIVFNLEQVSPTSEWITETYLGVLRSHTVWDYSEFNVAALRTKGVERIHLCGIGYARCLTQIAPVADEDVDVLFYGGIGERRARILDAVERAGLRVQRLFNVYGAERDAWIARAKVVLNIHGGLPERVFEMTRISYLLANRRFVVSEPGRGSDRLELTLRDGIVLAEEAELPELCRRYVADPAARRAVAQRGFELFSATSQAELLRAVLGSMASARQAR